MKKMEKDIIPENEAKKIVEEIEKKTQEKSLRKFREKNTLKMFKELNNEDQINIYSVIWSLTTKDLLYKCAKGRVI